MPGIKPRVSINSIRAGLRPLFEDETLRLVILFGSVAAGTSHGQSDIDLGFLFEGPVDILALTNRVTRLLGADNVDVVDLGRASPLLRFAAARTGKVVHEKEKGMYNAFYSLAFRMYIDTAKLREAQRTALRKFLESREPS
ncbi:MAG: nucleotidyltransferase domain-containing protein [Pseudomonadota bacterium]